MGERFNKLDDFKGRKPFRVPERYFEDFTEKMMRRLPAKEPAEETQTVVSLLDRVKPWLYLAASFIGMAVVFSIIYKAASPMEQETPAVTVTSPSASDEDDEFLEYIEDMYADKYASYYYLEDVL